jgi:hypothetical protein
MTFPELPFFLALGWAGLGGQAAAGSIALV